ncbi:MAG: restriction endonuclease subunit S, partial [Oscillospiraceae bacterium]
MAKLGEVFEKQIVGEWGNECNDSNIGVAVLRTTNFTNIGVIDYEGVVKRDISESKIKEKQLQYGDIILEKSGGTDKTPVGRVVFCDREIENEVFLCNNFTQAMRVNRSVANPKYVFYIMFYMHQRGVTDLLQSKTTGIRNLRLKEYLNYEIKLPNLGEQDIIVQILDKITALIALRKKQLDKLDELVKSRFIEMFGDPVTNPLNFP